MRSLRAERFDRVAGLKKALFYGDSNTFGYDPAGFMGGRYPRASRWTTILQENLAGEWQIEADGMPGRSLPISQYEWNYIRSMVRRAMPFDVFGVMLGTNDLLGTLYPDAARALGKMNALLDFVRTAWKEAAAEKAAGEENGEAAEKAAGEETGEAAEKAAGPVPSGLAKQGGGSSPAGFVLPESLEDGDSGENRGGRDACPGPLQEEDADEKPRALQILLIAPPKIVLTDLSYAEPYVSGDRTYAQIYYEEGRRLTQYYRALAASRGDAFADASSWDLDFAFDGVHLSEAGHAAFAAQMTEVMKKLYTR